LDAPANVVDAEEVRHSAEFGSKGRASPDADRLV